MSPEKRDHEKEYTKKIFERGISETVRKSVMTETFVMTEKYGEKSVDRPYQTDLIIMDI